MVAQVIAKARVPIIKFVEKTSGIAFDIRYTSLAFAI
jgi:DNA polymerase sigma